MLYRLTLGLFAVLSSTYICASNSAEGSIRKDTYIISSIAVSGNIITNEKIILRELTFSVGDSIRNEEITSHTQRSKQNLDNTLLFNFVTITNEIDNNSITWKIEVEERWYIWPFPVFEYADRNLSAFIRNGDYSRVNYGGYLRIDNFRGKREQIKLRLSLGYKKQIALNYITHNLDKNKKHGLALWLTYFTNHEVPFISKNNRPYYFTSNMGQVRSVFVGDISYQFRPKHNWYYTLTFGNLNATISDTVSKLNPNYFGEGKNIFNLNQIKVEVTLDKRNSKIFPLSGHLFDAEATKQGLTKGESIHLSYVKLSAGYYTKIMSRVYFGVDMLGKVSSKTNLPYFLNEALGFNDFIRGYEYYVTNGSHFAINKNSLKFELIPTKVVNLPLVPDGKFKKAHFSVYWSLFTDTGYVKPDSNTPNKNLEGNFLYGYGTGLYLVAYYDVVFRIEYSNNIFGEWGLFVHLGTPFLNN